MTGIQGKTQATTQVPSAIHIGKVPSAFQLPPYAFIAIGVSGAILVALFLVLFIRCLSRRYRLKKEKFEMTPKTSLPSMAGVFADQPIQFVVPSTIVVSETTEDSLSETDSSGSRAFSMSVGEGRMRKKTMAGFNISPSELQKGLYDSDSDGTHGAFLGDLGSVGFSLQYIFLRSQLCVRLIGASKLPCSFLKTTANPYAKVTLLPDKSPKYLTKVQRSTVSPNFNETFAFSVKPDQLDKVKVKISVWDYDRFSRKLLIGRVVYSLTDAGLNSSVSADVSTGDMWIALKQDNEKHHGSLGELLFSLCYNPDTATLTLSILKARNLPTTDKDRDLVYAKVTLYVRRKNIRTRKTSSKKKTPEVEFNENFSIHVPQSALCDIDILVTLCSRSGLGSRQVVGRAQVGNNCVSEAGVQHWQDMRSSQKSTAVQWHSLTG